MSQAEGKIFIGYAESDRKWAIRLYKDLTEAGGDPWMAEANLLPGQTRTLTTKQAMEESSYILLLLSQNSLSREDSLHKTIKRALELEDYYPPSQIFLIPLRLDDCEPEDYERLQELHTLDLFTSYEENFEKLLQVFGLSPQHREVSAPSPLPLSESREETSIENLEELHADLRELMQRKEQSLRGCIAREDFDSAAHEAFLWGGCYELLANNRQALKHYELALDFRPHNSYYLNSTGALAHKLRDYHKALRYFQRALEIDRDRYAGEGHLNIAIVLNNIAECYTAQKDFAPAEKFHLESLALKRELLDPADLSIGRSLNNLGVLYALQGNYERADTCLRRALAIFEDKQQVQEASLKKLLVSLALVNERLGKHDEVAQIVQRFHRGGLV